jgi:hypothetical protein
MKVLQVKQYNNTIAKSKWNNRINKCNSIPSMFFFYLDNDYNTRYGLNVERKKGYVAFDDNKAVFGMNKEKAINKFNQ